MSSVLALLIRSVSSVQKTTAPTCFSTYAFYTAASMAPRGVGIYIAVSYEVAWVRQQGVKLTGWPNGLLAFHWSVASACMTSIGVTRSIYNLTRVLNGHSDNTLTRIYDLKTISLNLK